MNAASPVIGPMKPIRGLSHEALGAGVASASDAMTSAPNDGRSYEAGISCESSS